MSHAAKSIFVFGIYVLAAGLTLMLAPNHVLTLAGLPATNEVWIRVMGMIVAFLGYYYLQAARLELTPFFRWTVHTRPLPVVVFIVFVALGLAKPIIILFGIGDLLGAIWTGLALRTSQSRALP